MKRGEQSQNYARRSVQPNNEKHMLQINRNIIEYRNLKDLYVKTIFQDFDLELKAFSSLKWVVGTLFRTPVAGRKIGVTNYSPFVGFFLIKSKVQMKNALRGGAVDEVDRKPNNWMGLL